MSARNTVITFEYKPAHSLTHHPRQFVTFFTAIGLGHDVKSWQMRDIETEYEQKK